MSRSKHGYRRSGWLSKRTDSGTGNDYDDDDDDDDEGERGILFRFTFCCPATKWFRLGERDGVRGNYVGMAQFSAFCFLLIGGAAQGQVSAYDDAGNYQRSANWTNASNQGFGFDPWMIVTNGPSFHGWYLNNGFAIRSVTNVGGTDYTNCSWGIYANGTGANKTVAYRSFADANSLSTNTAFKLQWMSRGIGSANANQGGFVLRNGSATNGVGDYATGARFQYYYAGGGVNSYLVVDGNGTNAIGIPFALGAGPTTGMECEFILKTEDTYCFVVRSTTNGNVLAFLDDRPLAGSGSIDSVALFAFQTTGDQNFNRMQLLSASLLAPVIVNVQPTNTAPFVNPGITNVTFEVESFGSTVAPTNVSLFLNGEAQALSFNTNDPAQHLAVLNTTALASNILYDATIVAVDADGKVGTRTFGFRTVQTNALWQDARSFGAQGNGTTRDTAAIQAAISACPAGGFVWLHDGVFLSGTIYLKDNMTLFIDPSATLLGSGAAGDYPTLNPPASNSQKSNCQKALVYAESRTNVIIDGGGKIYGNGKTNFTSGVESTRPISIWTALCDQVIIRNIAVVDSSMWTIVNMQSDHLSISNVTVNAPSGANRDGCDVVDCWHVIIQNCTIDSSDDSICIKSGNSRGVNDLVVRNCTITKSSSNGIKFGTASTGTFTNIVFQDCTVLNTSHSAMAVESVDGSDISDVTFERINFDGCQNAIFIVLGSRSGAAVGSIDRIRFKDINGSNMSDTRGCPISGCITNGITYRISNIVFDNVNISFKGGVNSIPSAPPEYAGQYPENTIWGNLPAYGYYLRHAVNITFTNCYTAAASADARPWMTASDVSSLVIAGPTLKAIPAEGNLVLQWDKPFVLQSAPNLAGPYTDLPAARSPYTNQTASAAQRFFRLRQ